MQKSSSLYRIQKMRVTLDSDLFFIIDPYYIEKFNDGHPVDR